MHLTVIFSGPMATVQDVGRLGYERFGVPPSGAMDPFALRAANRLVGNPAGAAVIEFALLGLTLRADEDGLAAVTGRGWTLTVQGRAVGGWRAARVFRGETLELTPTGATGWGCLAVLGGIDAPLVMDSRSTYLRGGFGGWQGRALQAGDALPVGDHRPAGWKYLAGRSLPPHLRPAYGDEVTLPVVTGPQRDAFTDRALDVLFSNAYAVSGTSDRMGYRLSGPRLDHRAKADLISEGLALGALQVPADGQPMAMMADRPTTGGYPKIAVVARAALPLLAQAMPGVGRLHFCAVSVAEAQAAYRQQMAALQNGIEEEEDEWTG